MVKRNLPARVFGCLGAVLAVTALLICLTQRNAQPRLFGTAAGAEECAQAMMENIAQGNYAAASAYLYGTPSLGTGTQPESDTAGILWEAFVSSLDFEPLGGCYATVSGLARDYSVSSLDLPKLTQALKDAAPGILESRLDAAEDMTLIYDENGEYRKAFAQSVLEEAARQVLASADSVDRTVTLNLVYEGNQWWVVPDQALLSAISGGIV